MLSFPVMLADKVLHGTEKLDGTQIVSMTIIGLLVVFCALLILVVFLCVSGGIFKKASGGSQKAAPKKDAPKPAPAAKAPAPAAKAAVPKASAPASGEDEEIIAVIMAAISAMGAAEGKQYQLRSVRQVTRGGSGRSVWAQAGVLDATRPF